MNKAKRVVIKVGTGALRQNGYLSDSVFFTIAAQVAELKREGFEVAVVSSGAVDAGKEWLYLLELPNSFNKGELSSIGTSELLERWKRAFLPHGLVIATGWLTHSVWLHRNQRRNLLRSGGKLSGSFTVPIINENDLLSRSELKNMTRGEGDNDYLARRVALLLEADIVLFVTESGGIWNGKTGKRVMYRELDGRTTFRLRGKNGGASHTGTGGPQSKINHASVCFRRGMCSGIIGVSDIADFVHGCPVGTAITDCTVLSENG